MKQFRVFLGNAPWSSEGKLGVRAGSRWPFSISAAPGQKIPLYAPFPFFLAYSTSVLEQNGFPALLIDAIATGIDLKQFVGYVESFKSDLILLETSTPTINTDLLTVGVIRDAVPGAKIALSGPHPSIMKRTLMEKNPEIDFILIGEYEYTLLELTECLSTGSHTRNVKGLIYRENGMIIENERRPVIEDLDQLPWPAYHHLPMYNYNDDFMVLEKPNVQMWTSRGCPFKCIFCMWPQVMYGNHLYRTRDPVKVVDEMEYLLRTYGFRGIYIDDDTFNIGKKRLMTLSREIVQRHLNTPWGVMARADTMDEETLAAMAEAGLVGIKYGIESADQTIVDASKKELDLEKAFDTIQYTQKHGIKVHLTFTFGLPGETRESIQRTIDLALSLKTHSVQFSIATPFPGTEFFDDLKQKGRILSENWDHYDGNYSAVMEPENVTAAELNTALKEAITRYWRERETWI